MARVQERYQTELIPALAKELGLKNELAVPRLQRVVVSMGISNAHTDRKRLEQSAEQLGIITGQKAKITRARR